MRKTLILFASLFILYSCGKRCSGKSSHSGIIVKVLNEDCFFFDRNQNFVIETDSHYQSIIAQYNNYECDTPIIDFNEYTLLGAYADGGCEVSFIKDVQRDDTNQKYIYSIKVKECGFCEVLRVSQNFVLVPKLPQNWTVDFLIN